MSDDPRRWSEDPDAPAGIAGALEDARADLPTDAQLASVAAKLGPLFGGGGGGGAGGASGPTGGGTTAGAVGAGTATGTKVVVFLLGGSLLIAALGTWAVIADRTARPRRPPEQAPVDAQEIVGDGGASPEADGGVDMSTPEESAPSPPPGPPPTSPPTTPSPSPSEGESPPSELELLQGAQDALGADPGAALRLLEDHRRIYPQGGLAQEREVLAIDALLRLGRRSDAEGRAERFRSRHPGSGQIRRIETLLARP